MRTGYGREWKMMLRDANTAWTQLKQTSNGATLAFCFGVCGMLCNHQPPPLHLVNSTTGSSPGLREGKEIVRLIASRPSCLDPWLCCVVHVPSISVCSSCKRMPACLRAPAPLCMLYNMRLRRLCSRTGGEVSQSLMNHMQDHAADGNSTRQKRLCSPPTSQQGKH